MNIAGRLERRGAKIGVLHLAQVLASGGRPVVTAGDLSTRRDSGALRRFLRGAVRFTVERLRAGKDKSTRTLGRREEYRERGQRVREHVIENLDYYLDRFASAVEARGQHVHFAADAAESCPHRARNCRAEGAKLVAKSKSMVSEEVEINHRLAEIGVEALETDLGEWIIQLAHEAPPHLIIPAIHKNRQQVRALFEAEGGVELSAETRVLAAHARRRLREGFVLVPTLA